MREYTLHTAALARAISDRHVRSGFSLFVNAQTGPINQVGNRFLKIARGRIPGNRTNNENQIHALPPMIKIRSSDLSKTALQAVTNHCRADFFTY